MTLIWGERSPVTDQRIVVEPIRTGQVSIQQAAFSGDALYCPATRVVPAEQGS